MADEVIVTEYAAHKALNEKGEPIMVYDETSKVTSQVLDIATASAEFGDTTTLVRLRSKGTGFWFKFGATAAAAAATAATDTNDWLPADQSLDFWVGSTLRFIDTAS